MAKRKGPRPIRKRTAKPQVRQRDLNPEQEELLGHIMERTRLQVEEAIRSGGHVMLGLWWLNGGDVKFWRKTVGFPPGDFETALDQMETDLRMEKMKMEALDRGPSG